MGTKPDELKTEVEDTRARLAHHVDRLADKAAPRRVARRKAKGAQRRMTGLKNRVMGSAGHPQSAQIEHKTQDLARSAGNAAGQAQDTVRQTADQAGQAVKEAPARVTEQTQGSPLAAGIIAFGSGMLAAALLPESEAEQRLGSQLREHSDELLEPAKDTAQEVAQELKEGMHQPAAEAAESVKATAQEAADATKQQAQTSGREAAGGLREAGQEAARETRGQADQR